MREHFVDSSNEHMGKHKGVDNSEINKKQYKNTVKKCLMWLHMA